MKKILIVLLILFLTLIGIVAYSLFFLVNQENLSFKTEYGLIDGTTIRENHKDVIVTILSTGCPGKTKTTPYLKENIKHLKEKNINYIIVADELYTNKVDNKLEQFKKEYDLSEEIYLMDIKKYPKNNGIQNAKRRYKEFVQDLIQSSEYIPLGYVNYIIIKDGKFIKSTPVLESEDFKIFE